MTEREELSGPGRETALGSVFKAPLLAVSMLTRIPVPTLPSVTARDLQHSIAFYPAVGALLGCAVALAAPLLARLGIPGLSGTALVALLALLTGGLHLDGLADLGDALGSGRDRQRMLEIMKDPRIGAHGASTLVITLAAKIALLECAATRLPAGALISTFALSRALAVVPLLLVPPARSSGLAHAVSGAPRGFTLVLVGLQLGMLAWLCGTEPLRLPLLLAALLTSALSYKAFQALGGVTGDVLGALIELAEVCLLLVLLAP